jgi:hypothetical protein
VTEFELLPLGTKDVIGIAVEAFRSTANYLDDFDDAWRFDDARLLLETYANRLEGVLAPVNLSPDIVFQQGGPVRKAGGTIGSDTVQVRDEARPVEEFDPNFRASVLELTPSMQLAAEFDPKNMEQMLGLRGAPESEKIRELRGKVVILQEALRAALPYVEQYRRDLKGPEYSKATSVYEKGHVALNTQEKPNAPGNE